MYFKVQCYLIFQFIFTVAAVAEINGRLEEFVEWHRKLKKSPSVIKLLVKDSYKGCGRIRRKAPPKKKKVEPIRERVELASVV